MKKKTIKCRNRILAIKGNPQFGQRVAKARKGTGSYSRVKVTKGNMNNYLVKVFTECIYQIGVLTAKTHGVSTFWRENK